MATSTTSGISSFTINDERMKQVNMVSYFKAGTQWATAAGNPKGVDPDNACGKNIAVQSNTTQETGRPSGAPEEVRQQQDQRLVVQGPEPGHQPPWSVVRLTPCWPTRRLWRTQ